MKGFCATDAKSYISSHVIQNVISSTASECDSTTKKMRQQVFLGVLIACLVCVYAAPANEEKREIIDALLGGVVGGDLVGDLLGGNLLGGVLDGDLLGGLLGKTGGPLKVVQALLKLVSKIVGGLLGLKGKDQDKLLSNLLKVVSDVAKGKGGLSVDLLKNGKLVKVEGETSDDSVLLAKV